MGKSCRFLSFMSQLDSGHFDFDLSIHFSSPSAQSGHDDDDGALSHTHTRRGRSNKIRKSLSSSSLNHCHHKATRNNPPHPVALVILFGFFVFLLPPFNDVAGPLIDGLALPFASFSDCVCHRWMRDNSESVTCTLHTHSMRNVEFWGLLNRVDAGRKAVWHKCSS